MPVTFYPHEDDLTSSTLQERVEVLLEAAERYKAVIMEASAKPAPAAPDENGGRKRLSPRDIAAVFNWEEIARLLREIREMPESNQAHKLAKADQLTKLIHR